MAAAQLKEAALAVTPDEDKPVGVLQVMAEVLVEKLLEAE